MENGGDVRASDQAAFDSFEHGSGSTTDAIRNTADLRSRALEGMSEIAAYLDPIVSDRVRRKFRFETAEGLKEAYPSGSLARA